MLLQYRRTLMKSCDLRVLLEIHRGLLSVQEHREETLIHDVDVATFNAMRNQRTQRKSGDLRVLWETHRGLLSVQEH